MAVLNGRDFFDNYLKNKVFPDCDYMNDMSVQQKIIDAWDVILSHIENNISVQVSPFVFIAAPNILGAQCTGFKVGFMTGQMLGNTGAILSQAHITAILIPAGVSPDIIPDILTNTTKKFNNLFNHIINNAIVNVSNITTSGTVVQGTSSSPLTCKSNVPAIGKII